MKLRTIRVPERLDELAIAELDAAIEAATRDDDARVWVLRGSPDVFCRGMDLATARDGDRVAEGARRYAAMLAKVRAAPRPTIAIVEGGALGGGVGIAAACDRVIATRSTVFGLPECLFGLAPAMVVPVLLERMRPQRVRALALSCSAISASVAETEGLVDDLVDERDLPVMVKARARALGRASDASVRALRSWIPRASTAPIDEAIEGGAELLAELARDPRTASALRAFVEEGTAPWWQ